MRKLLIILLSVIAATFALCLLSCKTNKATAYTVKFYIDGKQHTTFSAEYGSPLELPEIEDPDGDENVFISWFTSSDYDEWFTETTVTKNVSVYGYWTTYEDSLVSVTFYDNDVVVESYYAQKGSVIESYALPENDDGYSLDAWTVAGEPYDFNTRILNNLDIHSTKKPTEYTVEFISLGECVSTQTYTVENYDIVEPECPAQDHYQPGEWENYELTKGNIQVNAVYEPIEYTVKYVDRSDNVIGEYNYNILTYKEVVPPEPAEVPGCYCYWEKELECGMTVIKLNVDMLEYSIDYIVEDKIVATFNTTMKEYYELQTPDVPQRAGYNTSWEEIKFRQETKITVNIIYDPITYYINFVADNNVVDILEYNVENTEVEIPEFPEKAGYTGEWEDFTLVMGDVTVYAEYTPIDYTASFILFDELLGTEIKLEYTTTFNIENPEINYPRAGNYAYVAGCDVKWDEPKKLVLDDIEISGYYYDVDYLYLNFVQVKTETEHYFYVSGFAPKLHRTANVVIPDKYHNIPVSYIESSAFENDMYIETLDIYGIEKIEASAFSNCYTLLSVTLHEGLKTVEKNAFSSNEYITKIDIPETVTQIGESAFSGTGLIEVTLPYGLDRLSENLFSSCTALKKVIISDSVTEIGKGAFNECASLTEVTLGSGVEIIKETAFAGCGSLTTITISESVYLIESNAFKNCGTLNSINIPVSDDSWYYFVNNDLSNKQYLPNDFISDGNVLGETIKSDSGIGLYKEIN